MCHSQDTRFQLGWFHIQKSINLNHNIRKQKIKNVITSMDAEKNICKNLTSIFDFTNSL